jgi:hypothetical protein
MTWLFLKPYCSAKATNWCPVPVATVYPLPQYTFFPIPLHMYPSFHLAFGSCLILYKLCRKWRFFLCWARGVFSFSPSLNELYAEIGWFGFEQAFCHLICSFL